MCLCACLNTRIIKLTNTASFNDFGCVFDEHLANMKGVKAAVSARDR